MRKKLKHTIIIAKQRNKPIHRYGKIPVSIFVAPTETFLRVRMAEGYDGFTEETMQLPERDKPWNDPFAMLAAVIRNEITLQPYDLSSLENNLIVMQILDAAKQSAQMKKTVVMKK